jgi:hypothetical protein
VQRVLTLAIAIVLASSAARADTPQPLGAADVLGARSLALSAFRGVAGGNDGIFFNPAGLAARRRYTLEAQYLDDRMGADSGAQFIGLSVVDSATSSITGGLAWTRLASGQYIGNVFQLALAAPLGQGFYAGASGKFLSLNGPAGEEVRAVNADVGLFWTVNEMLSIGAAGYNLVSASNRLVMPRGAGAGIAVGTDRTFHITADWHADFDRQSKTTHAFGVGGEILVADLVPLRAGYLHDDILGGQWWSVGAGIVSASGVALDLSYRQSFDDTSRRTLAVGLKIFLSQ